MEVVIEGETTLKDSRVSAISFFNQKDVKNELDQVSFQIFYQMICSNKFRKLCISQLTIISILTFIMPLYETSK